MSRYVAEPITMIAGRFGHVGLCQLCTKVDINKVAMSLYDIIRYKFTASPVSSCVCDLSKQVFCEFKPALSERCLSTKIATSASPFFLYSLVSVYCWDLHRKQLCHLTVYRKAYSLPHVLIFLQDENNMVFTTRKDILE